MRYPHALLLSLLPAARAVYQDEVDLTDFHHLLLGIPHRETTFFHRPRQAGLFSKASLLYTLSDAGVLGAVNPSTGEVQWRQGLFLLGNITAGGASEQGGHLKGFARVGQGEDWICSALGNAVHGWDAVSGRNRFWNEYAGASVRHVEVMEWTEKEGRKDVLALFEEKGATVLRRLSGEDGSLVWEFRDDDAVGTATPVQISTNVAEVFVVSLARKTASGAYGLKVMVVDLLTGKRTDELAVETHKGDVPTAETITHYSAHSAVPVVAWTDAARTQVSVNVLGQRTVQTFGLPQGTVEVELHAPHLAQAEPHLLVHSRGADGHGGEVFHVDLKTKVVGRAYALPWIKGKGAFATSSEGAKVYFTRITEDEVVVYSSASHGVLGRWKRHQGTDGADGGAPLHAVAEVVEKKADTDTDTGTTSADPSAGPITLAVRAALVTDSDDWLLVRNGETAWTRPEGLSGAVAATFAEVPEAEQLASTLELEAHSNPIAAYMHRVRRHMADLQNLPTWLESLPGRLQKAIYDDPHRRRGARDARDKLLARDVFGFNKILVMATRRGRLYGLDFAHRGRVLWNTKVQVAAGEQWEVKGMHMQSADKGLLHVRGARGDHVLIAADTGRVVESMPPGSRAPVESTALVDSPSGEWLLPIGIDGHIGSLPAARTPRQTVVVRAPGGGLRGVSFVPDIHVPGRDAEITAWTFRPPPGQHITSTASHSTHDVVASVGRVLADRSVQYKYLNPNTLVIATAAPAHDILTIFLLDTVSGDVLHASTHRGVDAFRPVRCALSENWYLCTFFAQYPTFRGWQLASFELYQSPRPNDRGPFAGRAAANFSTFGPVDDPAAAAAADQLPPLPFVAAQSFVIPGPVDALAVTQTRQGVAQRQVLAYLPQDRAVTALMRGMLDPRRSIPTPKTRRATTDDDKDTPLLPDLEEPLPPYTPGLEFDPRLTVSHARDILGVQGLLAVPATVESTSLVVAWGMVDVFGARVAPSGQFDILGSGFNKLSLLGTVAALVAGVVVLGPVVRRKQVNVRWGST